MKSDLCRVSYYTHHSVMGLQGTSKNNVDNRKILSNSAIPTYRCLENPEGTMTDVERCGKKARPGGTQSHTG